MTSTKIECLDLLSTKVLSANLSGGAAPEIPLEATLRLEIQGSGFNLGHQFSHYTLRRCDVGSSSPSNAGNFIGKTVTHIRMRTGNPVGGQANTVYLAIYEGIGNAAVLKAISIPFNQNGLANLVFFDVPLLTPYTIGTDEVVEVAICTAVTGGLSVNFFGDSLNSDRKRITYGQGGSGQPPDFPPDWTLNQDSLANEAPEQQLIHKDIVALLNERTPV